MAFCLCLLTLVSQSHFLELRVIILRIIQFRLTNYIIQINSKLTHPLLTESMEWRHSLPLKLTWPNPFTFKYHDKLHILRVSHSTLCCCSHDWTEFLPIHTSYRICLILVRHSGSSVFRTCICKMLPLPRQPGSTPVNSTTSTARGKDN